MVGIALGGDFRGAKEMEKRGRRKCTCSRDVHTYVTCHEKWTDFPI